MGSIQSTAKSLDLVRNLVQKFINKEIDTIIQKYVAVICTSLFALLQEKKQYYGCFIAMTLTAGCRINEI